MDAIDDRTLRTIDTPTGSIKYVGLIHSDDSCGNPLKDMDQSVSFYVPDWGDGPQKWLSELLDGSDIPFDYQQIWKQPQVIRDRTTEASWYEESSACAWLDLFRRCDPSGIYLIVEHNESGYGRALSVSDDDCDATREYAIAYRTSEEIRTDQMVKRITAKARANALDALKADIETQSHYFAGSCYGWELLRQTCDEDGEVLESEALDSCFGYYGVSEWEYMYTCAAELIDHYESERLKKEDASTNAWAALDHDDLTRVDPYSISQRGYGVTIGEFFGLAPYPNR